MTRMSIGMPLVLIVISLAVLVPAAAEAHKPIIEGRDTDGYNGSIFLPDPDVSWGIYAYLDRMDDVDYYSFDAIDVQNLSTNILVPVKDVYRDFRPSYAIIGPGVRSTDQVPFKVPDGMGVAVIDMPLDSETFYEPFGGINYYRAPVNYTILDRPGRHYVAVFDHGGRRGDYVLAIGERESFGLFELPWVIWNTLRIRAGVWDHSALAAAG